MSTLTPTIPLSFPVDVEQNPWDAGSTGSTTAAQRTYLRQRIYKASGREAGIAAALRREAAQKRRVEERQARVQLFRSYRSGELPDIEGIRVSGFIAPLGQIAATDTSAACAIISAFARTMVEEAQSGHIETEVIRAAHVVERVLRSVFPQGFSDVCELCDRPLMVCIP